MQRSIRAPGAGQSRVGRLTVWGPTGIQLLGLEWVEKGLQYDLHPPRCFAFMGLFSTQTVKVVFYSGIGIKTNVIFSLKSSLFPFKFKRNKHLCGSLKAL